MKKILFDLTRVQPINGTKFHGGGIYGKVVFRKLAKMAPESLSVYYNPDIFLDDDIKQLISLLNLTTHSCNEESIIEAARLESAFIYSPLMRDEYLQDDSIFKIVTIHGLRTLEMPDDENQYLYKNNKESLKDVFIRVYLSGYKRYYDRTKRVFKQKKKYERYFSAKNMCFVTVSNHSKYSMLSFFPNLKEENLYVYYSPDTTNNTSLSDKYAKNPYGKYYLMISANRWLKNGIRAIQAFDQLFDERPNLEGKVIVTGVKDANFSTYKIKNKERFIFLGYVDDEQLKALYHHAYLFVYPSLNEGFGYPPLEAMHEGCPVACSAIASIPEVCGDAVLYFSPFSVSEIKTRILEMENKEIHESYRERGYARQRYIQEKQNGDLTKLCNYILSYTKRI